MIKMIASDVDGTLLRNGVINLTEDVFETIRQCRQRGIWFVVASGRPYSSLRRLFAPVWEDVVFAADNGALVMYRDQKVWSKVVNKEYGTQLVRKIHTTQGCEVMLSTRHTVYISARDADFLSLMANQYRYTVTVVDDVSAVDEDFIKISAHVNGTDIYQAAEKFRAEWEDRFDVLVSDNTWIDFGVAGKEDAIKALMESEGIQPQELLVFGDQYNDEGMMRLAGEAYAMEGAPGPILQLCGRSCNNVAKTIREIMNL